MGCWAGRGGVGGIILFLNSNTRFGYTKQLLLKIAVFIATAYVLAQQQHG